eukprot:SAG11_NODE_1723_length_4373_cov_8.121666_3_plen_325_part_00
MQQTKPAVIVDTDLGDDIDDTWALGHALRCKEFQVSFVLTAGHGDHVERARIATTVLDVAGADPRISVGLGVAEILDGTRYMFQEGWSASRGGTPSKREVVADGVGRLIELVVSSEQPVTVLAIGPMDNIVAALRREPRIASMCNLVSMIGSISKGHGGAPGAIAEFNVRRSPSAAREVLNAPWLSKTIAPMDTAGIVVLEGDTYRRVLESRAQLPCCIIEAFEWWLATMPESRRVKIGLTGGHMMKSNVLFDSVAVHLCRGPIARKTIAIKPMRLAVTDDGMTIISQDPAVPIVDVALDWIDKEAFQEELVDLITAESTHPRL